MTMKIDKATVEDLVPHFLSTKFAAFKNGDTVKLWIRNSFASFNADGIHSMLAERWEQVARIEECRITGTNQMWVTESGRDCDCVQYSGYMHKCEATLAAYYKLYDEINSYADGPFSLRPVTEEEREEIRPQSRDLAMEAYEDGHSHVVSAVRFDEDGVY